MRARTVLATALAGLAPVAVGAGAACGARTDPLLSAPPPGEPDASLADASFADVPPIRWPDAEPDVYRQDCADGGADRVYVLTLDGRIETFDPPTGQLALVGQAQCPLQSTSAYNSMAVDRHGTAYVSAQDGSLYRVDLRSPASCTPTAFVPGQDGWGRYGMGFSAVGDGPAEQLFVAEGAYSRTSRGLATIDVTSFAFRPIAAFAPPIGNALELTGTGDGRLFAFALDTPGPGSHLAEIDKTTARVIAETALPIGAPDDGIAVAFWGGDFYTFLSPPVGAPTTVSRWRPADGSLVPVVTSPDTIIGAGVSTCAPE